MTYVKTVKKSKNNNKTNKLIKAAKKPQQFKYRQIIKICLKIKMLVINIILCLEVNKYFDLKKTNKI